MGGEVFITLYEKKKTINVLFGNVGRCPDI